MAQLFPFPALYPSPGVAAQVAAVPYDVVSRAEAAQLAAENPLSFLRVGRAEIELSAETDPYSPAVYERARLNLARLLSSAPLVREPRETLYLYAQEINGHRQVGIAGAFSVDDYDADIIKKHEKTRQDKEDDRTRHILATRCHSGPVFLTFRPLVAIQHLLDEVQASSDPFLDASFADGVRHQVWRLTPEAAAELVRLFGGLPALYIADGHHRAKSASRVRESCRAANPQHRGDEAYNRFLGVAFPANHLCILPYNRVVRDLNGLTPAGLLERLETDFVVTADAGPRPAGAGEYRLYLGGRWYGLRPRHAATTSSPGERLDGSILQQTVLAPVLGIADPRTSKRIDFIGGIHGYERPQKLVDSGEFALAFILHPVTVEQLMAISDAGEIMPPKSTWFEPKLRDGLLLHTF
jgi:uncharacterized protein (DUF1015 family)